MNRFFSTEGGEPRFPGRSYARLDQIEPIDLAEARQAVFALEAVDADWEGFASGGRFDLQNPALIVENEAAFWARAFARPPGERDGLENPFEKTPLYRLEFTLDRGDPLFSLLSGLGEDWLEIELEARDPRQPDRLEVDVFAGLFVAPVIAHLARPPRIAPAAGLVAAFDMTTWPDAAPGAIEAALAPQCQIEHLAVFDIGQGSANALLCPHGVPMLWYDLGCGVYRNKFTRPTPLIRYCDCEPAPVVLSHWDADHWAGGQVDPRMLNRVWIAPRQGIGPTHKTFGGDILAAGGQILIAGHGSGPFSALTPSGQTLTLSRAGGPVSDRNASGLVLVVEDHGHGRSWLLTGDAGYRYISAPPANLSAIVAPHHGADMGAADNPHVPFRPGPEVYARLAFSFGPDNRHGRTNVQHPTMAAIQTHGRRNWDLGLWVATLKGVCKPGGDLLATAENPTGVHPASHFDGALIGWSSAPAPVSQLSCHGPACTLDLSQS